MAHPNPIAVLWGILRVLMTVEKPHPMGDQTFDHSALGSILTELSGQRNADLRPFRNPLDEYLGSVLGENPDSYSRDAALAFWINVYNAGALRLAAQAQADGLKTVLRVPGGFSEPFVSIAGENLSLDGIEHGKIRRFAEPRIHAALVCGSVSCPTLRSEVYIGENLEDQIEDQMTSFLVGGGAVFSGDTLHLSRVFSWFGSDFVRPHQMPTLVPSRKTSVVVALAPWLDIDTDLVDRIEYQGYDWGLRCSVGVG